jgi:hypothetical protein
MFQDMNSDLADLDPRSYPNSGAGSPWDELLDTSPLASHDAGASSGTPLSAACQSAANAELSRLPKLVPEVEEGNVEYKLKLCKYNRL